MSEVIVFTLLIPFVIGVSWLMTKAKRRRKKQRIEQGVADYLRRVSG